MCLKGVISLRRKRRRGGTWRVQVEVACPLGAGHKSGNPAQDDGELEVGQRQRQDTCVNYLFA